MNRWKRGARAGLLAEVGEFSAAAAEMAAAAVGLRGYDAVKAMTARRREREAARWASVSASAALRREQIILRDASQFDGRVRALLAPEGLSASSSKEI